jgi:alpha-mannosidase
MIGMVLSTFCYNLSSLCFRAAVPRLTVAVTTMLKHTRLTLNRIQQFVDRFLPMIRPERAPIDVLVAGPVGRISYAEAQKLAFKPARLGMALEPQWSTFWFRVRGNVPKAWRNGPVDLLFNTHSEAQVWHKGRPLQGLNYEGNNHFHDGGRIDFRVNDVMTASGKVELMIEAAANGMFGGSDRLGEYPTVCVYIFDCAELARFDQEAWDLYHDLLIPAELLKLADPDKLKPWEGHLLETLNAICNSVDPHDRATWPKARAALKHVYACRNATFGHEISAIGHAHLDTAWLWPLDETKRKALRTFTSALRYMDAYPHYKFACPQAVQYQWMKDYHPEVFAKIKAAVKRGQWVPVGGSWVEPDCNIPAGESLVRQFLYGQRFFRREFDWDCKEFWNPDVFGYSGALRGVRPPLDRSERGGLRRGFVHRLQVRLRRAR